MKLVLRLVETGIDGSSRSVDVLEIVSRSDPGDIAALGITLSQGKQLLGLIQQEVVAAQCRDLATRRPSCRSCAAVCQVKDYRPRQIATLFGQVTVRLPRFRCAGCGTREAAVDWPARCRSTPELDQLQAHLSALMPYRVAAGVLGHLLPVDAGISHESMRGRTLKLGEELRDAAALEPTTAAPAITLTLDSTFIRSCEEGQRHLEVRLGNVETSEGARQVFAAVAKTDTSIVALIQRSLAEVGQAQPRPRSPRSPTAVPGCARSWSMPASRRRRTSTGSVRPEGLSGSTPPRQSARFNDGVSREGTLSTQVLLPGHAKEQSDV